MTARTMSEVFHRHFKIIMAEEEDSEYYVWENDIQEGYVNDFLTICREQNPTAFQIVAVEEVWNVLNRG